MNRIDMLLDDDLDLIIENKDVVIGESDQQHSELITITFPGELKESPLTGFAAEKKLKSVYYSGKQFVRDLKAQHEADGYVDPEITFNNKGELEINI